MSLLIESIITLIERNPEFFFVLSKSVVAFSYELIMDNSEVFFVLSKMKGMEVYNYLLSEKKSLLIFTRFVLSMFLYGGGYYWYSQSDIILPGYRMRDQIKYIMEDINDFVQKYLNIILYFKEPENTSIYAYIAKYGDLIEMYENRLMELTLYKLDALIDTVRFLKHSQECTIIIERQISKTVNFVIDPHSINNTVFVIGSEVIKELPNIEFIYKFAS